MFEFPPKTLTDTEKLVLTAMLTRTYRFGVNKAVRPGPETLRITFESGVRDGDFRRFTVYDTDMSQPLEWATLVASYLCEDRLKIPKHPTHCDSWGAVVAEVKRLVTEKFEADKAEAQDDLESLPLQDFTTFHSGCVHAHGKVTDPWGPALSGPVMWWLDNMTLVGVWLIFQVVRNAAVDAVNEGLVSWTLDPRDGTDPRKAASDAYDAGLEHLNKDIRALLAAQPEAV